MRTLPASAASTERVAQIASAIANTPQRTMSHNVCIEDPGLLEGWFFSAGPQGRQQGRRPAYNAAASGANRRGQCQNCPRRATLAGAVTLPSPRFRGWWAKTADFRFALPERTKKGGETPADGVFHAPRERGARVAPRRKRLAPPSACGRARLP